MEKPFCNKTQCFIGNLLLSKWFMCLFSRAHQRSEASKAKSQFTNKTQAKLIQTLITYVLFVQKQKQNSIPCANGKSIKKNWRFLFLQNKNCRNKFNVSCPRTFFRSFSKETHRIQRIDFTQIRTGRLKKKFVVLGQCLCGVIGEIQ